ncbi:unnamed protein product [Dovyalis caffra]|uniref:Uncharacterized protein n=1 Tax=Dovyalis caffra TaxID=77055 RepID=A0AAV1RS25_9ROSI|nr:unnamed protein product [Dovyalis caffra]
MARGLGDMRRRGWRGYNGLLEGMCCMELERRKKLWTIWSGKADVIRWLTVTHHKVSSGDSKIRRSLHHPAYHEHDLALRFK